MLWKSFSKALSLAIVLCLLLGCCAFAMEGEVAQDAASAPLDVGAEDAIRRR